MAHRDPVVKVYSGNHPKLKATLNFGISDVDPLCLRG
jgi:hypothetical protein